MSAGKLKDVELKGVGKMKWENSLMAFEEDIKHRSWLDWLKGQATTCFRQHEIEPKLKKGGMEYE